MKRFIAVLAIAIIALALYFDSHEASAKTPTLNPAYTVTDGCTIRLLSTGPVALDDTAHACSSRITAVYVNDHDELVIEHSSLGRIVSCIAGADETLGKRGIGAGCSAAPDRSVFTLTKNATGAVVPPDSVAATGSSSNVWIVWVTEVVPATPQPTVSATPGS